MKRFALIGAAGYIAPRHMKAIKETGNVLLAALDKHDSVGILDSYFPEVHFFTEFERFDRHLDKLARSGTGVDFVTICSPNYLHDAHIRFALKHNADAICEKPLVLNPWNIDALEQFEQQYKRRIFTILQLRLHPAIIRLKEKVEVSDRNFSVDLTYITSRGNWYYTSWKGDVSKSGGVATNIGIHFFDVLLWIFGKVLKSTVHLQTHDRAAGFLELERANVRWFLSIDENTLPEEARRSQKRTYRSITVDGEEIEFSGKFDELHSESYRQILNGEGLGLSHARQSIELTHSIRTAKTTGLTGSYHPFATKPVSPHPFSRH